jgi:hypothetical protein
MERHISVQADHRIGEMRLKYRIRGAILTAGFQVPENVVVRLPY